MYINENWNKLMAHDKSKVLQGHNVKVCTKLIKTILKRFRIIIVHIKII